MSKIQRLTLISDPTDEFPNNANNSFKVRLPERLSLPGTGWHAALMSLTVPDQGQSNAVIATDPHTQVVKFEMTYLIRIHASGAYQRVQFKSALYTVELEEIMNAQQPVTSGSLFWKRVMQEVHNKMMHNILEEQKQRMIKNPDHLPLVSVKKTWLPQLSWKDDALVIHAIPKADLLKADKTANTAEFSINLAIALKFGLVVKKSSKRTSWYVLGPNLQFTCPTVAYDSQTLPTGSSFRAQYNWDGDHYVAIQPTDLFISNNPTNQPFQVPSGGKFLRLSLLVERQLNNLNASFEKLVGTSKRTMMVYSDIVKSTVVGSGKYPLLREVQLLRTGEGESTAEPLHHQWIKVRGQQMDILEVEIASTSGPLAILPPGKTLVTIGLKQL